MPGPDDRTIVGSRSKAFVLLMASFGLSAAMPWVLLIPGQGDWRAWLGLALFGPSTLLWTWMLMRPQELRLNSQGCTLTGGLVRTPKLIRWSEISGFFVCRLPRGGKMIGFNYLSGEGPVSALRRLNGFLGADGALPKNFPGSPEALVADLNAYRERMLHSRDAPPLLCATTKR